MIGLLNGLFVFMYLLYKKISYYCLYDFGINYLFYFNIEWIFEDNMHHPKNYNNVFINKQRYLYKKNYLIIKRWLLYFQLESQAN